MGVKTSFSKVTTPFPRYGVAGTTGKDKTSKGKE